MAAAALAATVTVSVFGLFHPHELTIEPWGTSRVQLRCGSTTRIVEGRAIVPLRAGCEVSSLAGTETDFVLSAPRRIRRHYRGILRVAAEGVELIPVITMSLEDAVASAVAAEAPPSAPEPMLRVQAIVSRSYFAATQNQRHRHSGFCDTTHCQFLRDPPSKETLAHRATIATTGQVLSYNGRIVQTYYVSRCNDRLSALPVSTLNPGDYSYFPIRCEFCARHPVLTGQKHHGLCQMGALGLIRQGLSPAEVLMHFFPGTVIHTLRAVPQ
jgi:peptidoglycan hydrolase-like amidase